MRPRSATELGVAISRMPGWNEHRGRIWLICEEEMIDRNSEQRVVEKRASTVR